MAGEELSIWLASAVLLSLRIAPMFLFAPPFTLTRLPRLFLALFGLGVAACLVSANPETARLDRLGIDVLVIGAIRELLLGIVPVVVLQLLFGALYVAGRTIDIQSGYGLALLIDPATRGQTPLVGTIFAYLAGAMFFALDGHGDMLRFFAASLEAVPVGAAHDMASLGVLASYAFVIFMIAFGVAGGAILVLFLTDLLVALLSRTVPQMNALLLGIQVKSILLLVVLPFAISMSGILLAQMVTAALRSMARLI